MEWTLVTKAQLACTMLKTYHLLCNTHIIDAELAKECAAGHILSPFRSWPLTNSRCSSVGVVPKKHNKWRMIMHLSAPVGNRLHLQRGILPHPLMMPLNYFSLSAGEHVWQNFTWSQPSGWFQSIWRTGNSSG